MSARISRKPRSRTSDPARAPRFTSRTDRLRCKEPSHAYQWAQSSSLPSIPHSPGCDCAAHSCQGPHHARATRRLGQRGHDLHGRDKERHGASNRARHEESHDGNFSNTFELVSRLRGCWTCPNGCSPLPTNSGAFLLRRVGWLLADIVSKVFLH